MSAPQAPRKAIVFLSLVAVLTCTSALLLALSPAPLRPEASASLFNAEAPVDGMDAVFATDRPITAGRWTSILVHQSKTLTGDARTLARQGSGLADHFVICNGDGGIDGEIQLGTRWADQAPAASPTKSTSIDPRCISICLVGNFDHTPPTPAQLRRTEQLVESLQDRLNIPAARVYVARRDHSAAGVGTKFPADAFRH